MLSKLILRPLPASSALVRCAGTAATDILRGDLDLDVVAMCAVVVAVVVLEAGADDAAVDTTFPSKSAASVRLLEVRDRADAAP
eukprot:1376386-Rhodomonas_salina.1